MTRILRDYGLSIVLVFLFLISWFGQAVFQWQHQLEEAVTHGQEITTSQFASSFLASTFENWQSEFLQLFSFVILSTYLIHRNSPQSKDGDEETLRLLRRIDEKLKHK